jgi:hypothetical protein
MNNLNLADYRAKLALASTRVTNAEAALKTAEGHHSSEQTRLQAEIRERLRSGEYTTGNPLQDTLLQILSFEDCEAIEKIIHFSERLEKSTGEDLLLVHQYKYQTKHVMFPTEHSQNEYATAKTYIFGRTRGAGLQISLSFEKNSSRFSITIPTSEHVVFGRRGKGEGKVEGDIVLPSYGSEQPTSSTFLQAFVNIPATFFLHDVASLSGESTKIYLGEDITLQVLSPGMRKNLVDILEYIPPEEIQTGSA